MTVITKKLPSFEGVGAGQTATVRCPRGLRYHKVELTYSGVTLAQINEIRVIANGKTINRYLSGAVLDAMNQFDGRNAAAGVLVIDFERYGLRTRAGSEFTVLDTGNDAPYEIGTLSIEVDIDGAAVAPVLSGHASLSGTSKSTSGMLKQVRSFGHDPSAIGEYEISDLPKIGAINRVFFKSAVTINSIKLERNGYIVSDRTEAVNELMQADGVRVPQSGYYVLDFTEEGNGQDWVEVIGMQEVRFTLDMAAAGHVDVIVEYLDQLR